MGLEDTNNPHIKHKSNIDIEVVNMPLQVRHEEDQGEQRLLPERAGGGGGREEHRQNVPRALRISEVPS